MTNRHYADAVMLAFVDGVLDSSELDELSHHILCCGDCQAHRAELVAWCEILTDPSTWELVAEAGPPPMGNPNQELVSNNFAEIEQIAESLRSAPTSAWPDMLRFVRGNESVIRFLLAEARAKHDAEPEVSLTLADCAASKLRRLQRRVPALEGDVGKERANALRHLGRFREALDALEAADRAYAALPIADYDRAFVRWSRATVYFEMKRFADARAELNAAKQIFRLYADSPALAQIGILEGGILFDEGSIEAARQQFVDILPVVKSVRDDESVARVLANLCTCELRLNMLAQAIEHGRAGFESLMELGKAMEANRLLWSVGDALAIHGNDDEALETLTTAADRFDSAGMTLNAAAVRVDMLEMLLRRGEWERARDVAAAALTHFRREGADVDAASALDYLHQALAAMRGTPELARYVREHLVRINSGDRRPFIPPVAEAVQ